MWTNVEVESERKDIAGARNGTGERSITLSHPYFGVQPFANVSVRSIFLYVTE
jgi:hypothetical protein